MKKVLCILAALVFSFACPLVCVDEARAGGGPVGGGGKGGAPSVPPPPAPAPMPDTTPQEAESRAVRDDERRKLSRQKGVGGTLLAPLGGFGAGTGGDTLLGRIGR